MAKIVIKKGFASNIKEFAYNPQKFEGLKVIDTNDLRDNIKLLMKVLRENQISILRFEGDVTMEGARLVDLQEALQGCTSLTTLKMEGGKTFGGVGLKALFSIICFNKSITDLTIATHGLVDNDADTIATALRDNGSIQRLDLSSNKITSVGLSKLRSSLKAIDRAIKCDISHNIPGGSKNKSNPEFMEGWIAGFRRVEEDKGSIKSISTKNNSLAAAAKKEEELQNLIKKKVEDAKLPPVEVKQIADIIAPGNNKLTELCISKLLECTTSNIKTTIHGLIEKIKGDMEGHAKHLKWTEDQLTEMFSSLEAKKAAAYAEVNSMTAKLSEEITEKETVAAKVAESMKKVGDLKLSPEDVQQIVNALAGGNKQIAEATATTLTKSKISEIKAYVDKFIDSMKQGFTRQAQSKGWSEVQLKTMHDGLDAKKTKACLVTDSIAIKMAKELESEEQKEEEASPSAAASTPPAQEEELSPQTLLRLSEQAKLFEKAMGSFKLSPKLVMEIASRVSADHAVVIEALSAMDIAASSKYFNEIYIEGKVRAEREAAEEVEKINEMHSLVTPAAAQTLRGLAAKFSAQAGMAPPRPDMKKRAEEEKEKVLHNRDQALHSLNIKFDAIKGYVQKEILSKLTAILPKQDGRDRATYIKACDEAIAKWLSEHKDINSQTMKIGGKEVANNTTVEEATKLLMSLKPTFKKAGEEGEGIELPPKEDNASDPKNSDMNLLKDYAKEAKKIASQAELDNYLKQVVVERADSPLEIAHKHLRLASIYKAKGLAEKVLEHCSIAHNAQQDTPDREATVIAYGGVGFSSKQKMGCANIINALALTFYSPTTKLTALTYLHFDTDIEGNIERIMSRFSDLEEVEVRMIGGAERDADVNILMQRILPALEFYKNINIKSADIFEKTHPYNIVINPQDGTISAAIPLQGIAEERIADFESFCKKGEKLTHYYKKAGKGYTSYKTTYNVAKDNDLDMPSALINMDNAEEVKALKQFLNHHFNASYEFEMQARSGVWDEYYYKSLAFVDIHNYIKKQCPDLYKSELIVYIKKSFKDDGVAALIAGKIMDAYVPVMYRLDKLLKEIEANRDGHPDAPIETAIDGVCNAWNAEIAMYNNIEQGWAEDNAAAAAESVESGSAAAAAHERDEAPEATQEAPSSTEPEAAMEALASPAEVGLLAEIAPHQSADSLE